MNRRPKCGTRREDAWHACCGVATRERLFANQPCAVVSGAVTRGVLGGSGRCLHRNEFACSCGAGVGGQVKVRAGQVARARDATNSPVRKAVALLGIIGALYADVAIGNCSDESRDAVCFPTMPSISEIVRELAQGGVFGGREAEVQVHVPIVPNLPRPPQGGHFFNPERN